MSNFKNVLSAVLLSFFSLVVCAQQAVDDNSVTNTAPTTEVIEKTPEVGKHVMANMDAGSMILSLLMVLAVIFISAIVLKRFNVVQQNTNQLKMVANLSLGSKERIVVIQVAEQQLVLGVTPQQVTLIDRLDEPLDTSSQSSLPMAGNVLAFLQKTNKTQK
jgi:flagellar protein FliO/FliZ